MKTSSHCGQRTTPNGATSCTSVPGSRHRQQTTSSVSSAVQRASSVTWSAYGATGPFHGSGGGRVGRRRTGRGGRGAPGGREAGGHQGGQPPADDGGGPPLAGGGAPLLPRETGRSSCR